MTQVHQVAKTRTDAKTCVSCAFLQAKDIAKIRILWKCLLTGQPRNPNMYACSLHKERTP